MRKTETYIRKFIFTGILVSLSVPFVLQTFSVLNNVKLEGAFIPKEKSSFSFVEWFSRKFQQKTEEYVNENFGFRNYFVRLNNQLSFGLFKKAHADNIVVGRNDYLFQKPSIDAYLGLNFLGADLIEKRIVRLKYISDTLARRNKNLILIFGPGKGSYYPEFIPDRFKSQKTSTNLEYYIMYAKKYGLNYIEINAYFIAHKNTSAYPLYPQYGIHWSRYGGYLAADSLLHYIESVRHADLPEIIVDSISFRQPENEDYDIAGGMNLLFRLKSFSMTYPQIHVETDSGKTKPSVLVIGDSFYWGLQNMEISKAFSDSKFWFYYNRGTAGDLKELADTTKLRMLEEMKKYDIIVLIAKEFNLPQLGWGFIEDTYAYYKGINLTQFNELLLQEEVNSLKEQLKRNKERMKRIFEMASQMNISVDSMLTLRAIERIKINRNRRDKIFE